MLFFFTRRWDEHGTFVGLAGCIVFCVFYFFFLEALKKKKKPQRRTSNLNVGAPCLINTRKVRALSSFPVPHLLRWMLASQSPIVVSRWFSIHAEHLPSCCARCANFHSVQLQIWPERNHPRYSMLRTCISTLQVKAIWSNNTYSPHREHNWTSSTDHINIYTQLLNVQCYTILIQSFLCWSLRAALLWTKQVWSLDTWYL